MGWMAIWWILAIALVALGAWAVGAALMSRSRNAEDSPERVLKRRYASGEIDRETYDRILQDLKR